MEEYNFSLLENQPASATLFRFLIPALVLDDPTKSVHTTANTFL